MPLEACSHDLKTFRWTSPYNVPLHHNRVKPWQELLTYGPWRVLLRYKFVFDCIKLYLIDLGRTSAIYCGHIINI